MLCHTLRLGYRPAKVAFLGWSAWHDRTQGRWPEIPETAAHEYGMGEIRRWLGVLLEQFSNSASLSGAPRPTFPRSAQVGSLCDGVFIGL